ncbi:unnamed protein product [Alternaria alternata]
MREAENYLTIHEVSNSQLDYRKMANPANDFKEHLQLDSVQVDAMSKAQMNKQQKKRLKWAIKNKEKFGQVVSWLRKYNDDLVSLLTEPSILAFAQALPAYVIANTIHIGDLRRTQEVTGPTISLRTWIEWLDIERTLTPLQASHAQERIKTLSVMLYSAPESFRVAKCIGYLNDLSNSHRTGLVFRVPPDLGMAVPISLLDIIKGYKETSTPPLGDRFKLAQALATTVMQLHTSDWLHKALRGDNILFFSGLAGPITDPYLAGFEYARDMNMQSLGLRPNGRRTASTTTITRMSSTASLRRSISTV